VAPESDDQVETSTWPSAVERPRRSEDAMARLAAWSIAYENLPSPRRS
jgi:hypothetical protein